MLGDKFYYFYVEWYERSWTEDVDSVSGMRFFPAWNEYYFFLLRNNIWVISPGVWCLFCPLRPCWLLAGSVPVKRMDGSLACVLCRPNLACGSFSYDGPCGWFYYRARGFICLCSGSRHWNNIIQAVTHSDSRDRIGFDICIYVSFMVEESPEHGGHLYPFTPFKEELWDSVKPESSGQFIKRNRNTIPF